MASPASTSHDSRPGLPPNFLTIQSLRAIAALMVVLYHALEVWGGRIDADAPFVDWENGAAGVDIFFVVSGFVMIVASRRLVDAPMGWLTFLRHRVARIVPLYWLLTSVKLAAVLALPWLAVRTSLDPVYITGSYLFLPVIDHVQKFRPLIPMGWTLTYEMLFYLFFAAALAIRTDVLRVIVPGLGAIALLGLMRDASWPAWTVLFSTIVLEFIFGVLLAKWTLQGGRLSPTLACATLVVGVVAILGLPMVSENWRVVTWGVPALAIVAGAVSLERTLAGRIPHWLLSLGDASYSIYLSHGFVIPVMVLIAGRMLPDNEAMQLLTMTLCLLGSAALGWVLHGLVEQPMLRAMRDRKRAPPKVAKAAA
jgi:peptidoglycan/LPS O-acetylase OafA/YrhL